MGTFEFFSQSSKIATMAHRETMIQRERRMQERAANASYNASQTSSYSSNVQKESSTSAQYNNEESRHFARDDRRYLGDNGYQQRQQDDIDRDRELDYSPPQDRATPPSSHPQSQAAPPSQPAYQSKPSNISKVRSGLLVANCFTLEMK